MFNIKNRLCLGIAFCFVVVNLANGSNDSLGESMGQRLLDKLGGVGEHGALHFKATHSLQSFLPDAKTINEKSCYTRNIDGLLTLDGLFRIEITYTSGAAQGLKYTICFDGKRTFIVNTNGTKNYLVTGKGRVKEIPQLFHAIGLTAPFAFLFPDLFNPKDKGAYVILSDIMQKSVLSQWFNGANVSAADANDEIRVEKRGQLEGQSGDDVDLYLSSKSLLPLRFTVKVDDSYILNERYNIKWSELVLPNGLQLNIPKQILISKEFKGGASSTMTTDISSVEVITDPAPNLFQYDINDATTIFDMDEKLLIPNGVK